jgi:hypothetical protein
VKELMSKASFEVDCPKTINKTADKRQMIYLNTYSSRSEVDKVLKLFGSETTVWCPNPLNFKAILND